ncbi:MAG: M56 family metallopeptidase [Isosphaerales bacterium]
MNTISLMLLGSIAHATGFAIAGTLVYMALRRFGPAAGALASSTSIVVMALVSLVVLGPWPRWWVLAPRESAQTTSAPSAGIEEADRALLLQADGRSRPRPTDGTPRRPIAPSPRELPSRAESSFARLLADLTVELRPTPAGLERTAWGWPAWIAAGFLVSLCLGLARLGLGILTIRGLRARSRPILDAGLNEEIQILRAELSCTWRVEARETGELATPATIGWRRPILLLPGDWREWNHAERRAVLAHELAHVRRADFLAGLAAQLSLALHFYHPLAHWLAARLRLEQELAADAWGAALSGGKTTYLATLARMALRRDTHTLSWPARAFLPARGTFVRRIEMLRNTKRISHASLPTAARLLTVGLLAALGLLVAGLRGPAGRSMAQAQTQPHLPPLDNSKAPAVESYNLAFLPADAKMVVAVRPQTLLQRREVRTLLESIKQSPAFQRLLVVPPEDVEQLLVFWEGLPQAERGRTPLESLLTVSLPSGMVVRMTKPQEWKPLLNQLLGSPREVRHDGQTYLRIAGPGGEQRWGAFAPDDRTLVIAHEDLLRELIEDRKAPAPRHPWDECWSKVAKGQVMVALETRWLRRRIGYGVHPRAPGPQAELALETIAPLLEKAQSYALGINASEGLAVNLVAAAGSDDDAKRVAETIQALLTLARNAVEGSRQDRRARHIAPEEAMEWILQAASLLLEKARVETSGGYVRLQAKSSVDLAEGVKLLAPAVVAARQSADRSMSVNNLKQIALAFHNYHATKGRLPTPVLYGGASGKVPYSWRVAILPYLEQQELYNRYNFDEPWDGPSNRKLLDVMPATYSYPGLDGNPSSRTNTSYFVFTGEGTALCPIPAGKGESGPTGPTFMDVTDGISNTILAVEAQRNIPWTKPEDIPFDPNGPVPELGGFTPDGFNACFADGSVRYLKKSINPIVLKALITRAGGEVISNDSY